MNNFNFTYSHKSKARVKQLRHNQTLAEKIIWYQVLSRRQFCNLRWCRQKQIGNYIVDFYCPKLRLVVEIDGDTHAGQEQKDEYRTNILKAKFDLKVIRYQNNDVITNIEGVVKDLITKIPPTPLGKGGHVGCL